MSCNFIAAGPSHSLFPQPPYHSYRNLGHSTAYLARPLSMKLTKRSRLGYGALSDEKEVISPAAQKKTLLDEKTETETLQAHHWKLLPQCKWFSCPNEAMKDSESIFDFGAPFLYLHADLNLGRCLQSTAPDFLRIHFEPDPNGAIALDSRNHLTWASAPAMASDSASGKALAEASMEVSTEHQDLLRLWLEALEQHHRIHRIKVEMAKEKKKVGWARWKYWMWKDKRQGTRRAWERLGKRLEERMEKKG